METVAEIMTSVNTQDTIVQGWQLQFLILACDWSIVIITRVATKNLRRFKDSLLEGKDRGSWVISHVQAYLNPNSSVNARSIVIEISLLEEFGFE